MKLIIVPIIAIIAITGLEFYALSQGIDGAIMAGSFAIIAGLGGYEAKAIRERYRKPK